MKSQNNDDLLKKIQEAFDRNTNFTVTVFDTEVAVHVDLFVTIALVLFECPPGHECSFSFDNACFGRIKEITNISNTVPRMMNIIKDIFVQIDRIQKQHQSSMLDYATSYENDLEEYDEIVHYMACRVIAECKICPQPKA